MSTTDPTIPPLHEVPKLGPDEERSFTSRWNQYNKLNKDFLVAHSLAAIHDLGQVYTTSKMLLG
jgi:hypothetical protein